MTTPTYCEFEMAQVDGIDALKQEITISIMPTHTKKACNIKRPVYERT
jgi:hypothetical protein